MSFATGDVALFPELAGWSARDVATRAVTEHGAWLAAGPHEPNGEMLGKLATAARAAAFLQSIEDGEPALATGISPLFDDAARAAYPYPPADVVRAFEQAVRDLPAYRS